MSQDRKPRWITREVTKLPFSNYNKAFFSVSFSSFSFSFSFSFRNNTNTRMIPQQWASPCGNQCTNKYAALTKIPCNVTKPLQHFFILSFFLFFFKKNHECSICHIHALELCYPFHQPITLFLAGFQCLGRLYVELFKLF